MIAERGLAFRSLHEREGAFVIPNPWDIGTARILAHMGFEALATTSAGYAFSVGKRDNAVGRDEMMAHLRAISAATDLPVSADLENGYGSTLEAIVETYRMAADAGVVGASIEDASGESETPIFDQARAADRVRAVAESVHALPTGFTLTARAENYLHGRKDLNDTIRRLQAYQEAGADVLYAPGLTTKEDIAAVVSSVDRPVNVLMGLAGARLSVAELAELGVKRISVGSAFCRAAMGAFVRAAKEVKERGTFTFAEDAISFGDISAMF
jgi:2-methylisocitrate lyase-like PEP mutase family enzyme